MELEQKFLTEFREALDIPTDFKIDLDLELNQLPWWDSLAVVSCMNMLDLNFRVSATSEEIKICKKIRDIYQLTMSV